MKRGLIVLLLTALPIAPGRAQQPQSAALEDAIVAAWRSNALPPVDYVVSKFAGADWVFLGEYHRIRDDVRLIAELIPALHSRTEVRHLAAEFLRRDRTAAANELITAPDVPRSDAVEFLRSQDPHWPYEEYVELLRAAWESNRVHAAQRGEFRFIGLHPGIDWEAINYGTDPDAVALERRKQDEYDAIMAAELEKHLLVPGQPALISRRRTFHGEVHRVPLWHGSAAAADGQHGLPRAVGRTDVLHCPARTVLGRRYRSGYLSVRRCCSTAQCCRTVPPSDSIRPGLLSTDSGTRAGRSGPSPSTSSASSTTATSCMLRRSGKRWASPASRTGSKPTSSSATSAGACRTGRHPTASRTCR
jgi:hypothetical protein